ERHPLDWLFAFVWMGAAMLAAGDVHAADQSDRAESPASCSPEVVTGGIACIRDGGERSWTNIHPSLWGEWVPETRKAFEKRTNAELDAELATVRGRIFYSVRRDVLEVDARGRIQNRARFPARVQRLTEGGATRDRDPDL
ncbi:MAG: hypothetical protein ABEN55_10815, partial [Bradymonadaceae bacterium]